MAFHSVLLRCLAKNGVKHLANLLTLGVGGDLLTDAWEEWRREQNDAERRAEIERLAAASAADAQAAATEALQQVGASLSPEQSQQLAGWLTQTPAAIRRSLRRPSDPSGRTVTAKQNPRNAGDLAGLVPPKAPRFRAGDRPLAGVDLELEELLGVGGFGEVWKARNPRRVSAAPVALKFCLDEKADLAQLEHELKVVDRVMGSGAHPGIVPLKNTYLSATPPCLEYEYVPGGDLAALIQDWHREGKATPERVAGLMLQLCDIVAFAHEQGVVHRDLKPANILVTESGALRVADFGIGGVSARHAQDQAKRDTFGTASLATVARGAYTPLYASPQQMRGEKPAATDDVYSLGVVWHQMLTGELGDGAPTGEAWKQELRRKGVSEAELGVLVSCLEGKAAHRPASARVVEQRLRQARKPRRSGIGQGDFVVLGVALLLAFFVVTWLVLKSMRVADKPEQNVGDKSANQSVSDASQKRSGETAVPSEIANWADRKMVSLPGGRFQMGSPDTEKYRASDEKQYWATVSALYMGKTEVTQEQFRAVMGYNPSYFSRRASGRSGVAYGDYGPGGGVAQLKSDDDTEKFPVENLSWEEANEFCDKLNTLDKTRPSGWLYRLPREAEWEYSCRGGAAEYQVFHFGNTLDDTKTQANFDGKLPYSSDNRSDCRQRPCQVGHYKPNKFGLHDMHGNVVEWCADWYDSNYYAEPGYATDPPCPRAGSFRVLRGGGWSNQGQACRSAYRFGRSPWWRDRDIGFRVALVSLDRK